MSATFRKKRCRAAVAILLCVQIGALAHAQPALRPLPPILSPISDEVGMLTDRQGQALADTVARIEQRTGVKIVMTILTTTAPESLDRYSLRFIDRWRHQRKLPAHGRFIFVAVTRQDRAVRIVPSAKLAWVLREVRTGELATEAPTLFKQDKYFEALSAIADRLAQLLTDRSRPRHKQVTHTRHGHISKEIRDDTRIT